MACFLQCLRLVVNNTIMPEFKLTTCTECFGIGTKETLIVLDEPLLDSRGKLILYMTRTALCPACSEHTQIAAMLNSIPVDLAQALVEITGDLELI